MSIITSFCWFLAGACVTRLWVSWVKWDPYVESLKKARDQMAALYARATLDLVDTEMARTEGFMVGIHQANEAWKARLEEAYERAGNRTFN